MQVTSSSKNPVLRKASYKIASHTQKRMMIVQNNGTRKKRKSVEPMTILLNVLIKGYHFSEETLEFDNSSVIKYSHFLELHMH